MIKYIARFITILFWGLIVVTVIGAFYEEIFHLVVVIGVAILIIQIGVWIWGRTEW